MSQDTSLHQDWCKALVSSIRHGGRWGIPRSGLVFEIDHVNKRLVLVHGDSESEDYQETRRQFAGIAWEVSKNEIA